MKKMLKLVGITAIIAAIVFSMAACEIVDEDSGDFTNVNDFVTWLGKQPNNTKETPYIVKLNVDQISGLGGTIGALQRNPNKYVNLDLSGSTATTIPGYAFFGCKTLIGITMPNRVTSIGEAAFYGCGLTSVTIPNSIISMGKDAFLGCDLTSVTIMNSVIGQNAFSQCKSLTSITIPDSVTSLGDEAFYLCTSLTNITIGSGVTSLGVGVFWQCTSLTSVTIPNNVTSINNTFQNCTSLTSVTIPNSVTIIGGFTFSNCTSLASVIIPESVTRIGGGAFKNCTSLTSVTFQRDGTTDIPSDYDSAFPGNLVTLSGGNGEKNRFGTYTRPSGGNTWTKQ